MTDVLVKSVIAAKCVQVKDAQLMYDKETRRHRGNIQIVSPSDLKLSFPCRVRFRNL